MATSVEELLARAAAPLASSEAGTLAQEMDRLTGQLGRLQTVNQAAIESVRASTQVVKTSAPAASSGSSGGSVGGTFLSVLGLGLGPLLPGMARLFGGGRGAGEPSPVVKFALPGSLNVNAGVRAGVPGAFAVDHAQGGSPRPVAAAPQQITVHVQAMDSRSFMDHSGEIAMAVRQAMLESSVLNDVVREA